MIFANGCSTGFLHPFRAHYSGRILDWLIFNAGVAEVSSFDWVTVITQLLTDPMLAFTLPRFLVETVGSKSADGIGYVFQANVFGHYYIVFIMLLNKLSLSSNVSPHS